MELAYFLLILILILILMVFLWTILSHTRRIKTLKTTCQEKSEESNQALLKMALGVDYNDKSLSKQYAELLILLRKMQTEVNEVSHQVKRDREQYVSMQNMLMSIPKVRVDLPWVDSQEEYTVMHSERLEYNLQTKRLIYMKSDADLKEGFMGVINDLDMDALCGDPIRQIQNATICTFCENQEDHVCDASKPETYWLNTEAVSSTLDDDFITSCLDRNGSLLDRCELFTNIELKKRLNDAYYAFSNIVNSMTSAQLLDVYAGSEANKFNITLIHGEEVKFVNKNTGVIYETDKDFSLAKSLLIIAYYRKKVQNKGMPYFKVQEG